MRGKVSDLYIAILPDPIEDELNPFKNEDSPLKDFQIAADADKQSRMELASQKGTVYQVGKLAYDYKDETIEPDCEVGDRVWFVRHVAKVVEDESQLDDKGKPKKIFVMTPDNLVWNEGKDE